MNLGLLKMSPEDVQLCMAAANAVGLQVWDTGRGVINGRHNRAWEPLHNKDQALGLAIDLRLNVMIDKDVCRVTTKSPRTTSIVRIDYQDPWATTRGQIVRRAIVIAASKCRPSTRSVVNS